ncbi:MAG: Cytochrome bd-I ubiquinol oxidase subunit 2 [Chlamydiae bacterium]|nr:Cytochrome bd-I ubiquinol oxidase subunit 2 [Chlamydiota bacterium]
MELLEIFHVIWYLVIGVSFVFYTVLDGFDLGVGCLHLFTRSDRERRVMLNAIGPVWDGNEVWLVIIFGGLFVGFANIYATICSAFYTLIMILLSGLMIRAVAIEFRSKQESLRWRRFWDGLFSGASYIIAFSLGLILGNLIVGIPLDQNGDFQGTFLGFFTPYTILVGLTGVAVFTMHGAIYMLMKTEGALHERIRRWVNPSIVIFVILYILTTFATLLFMPHMTGLMRDMPWLFLIALLTMFSIAGVPFLVNRKCDGWAFISSSFTIMLLFALFGVGTYPNMVRSSIDPAHYSLDLFNSGASMPTMKVVLLIAVIGVPLVLAYGWWVYHIFRGKVSIDDMSY